MSTTTHKIEQEMDVRYSLGKRVPAMENGFAIETSYGAIQVSAEDAAQIIKAVERMLEKKLKGLI